MTAVKASAEDQEVRICSTFAAFPNIQILHLTFCITLVFSDFYGDLTLVTRPTLQCFCVDVQYSTVPLLMVLINQPSIQIQSAKQLICDQIEDNIQLCCFKFMFVFILFGFHSRLVVLFESKSREGQN